MRLIAGVSLACSLAMLAAAPARAEPAEPKINFLIVYGEDKCPESKGDEITVCAIKNEGERYRIPEEFRSPATGPSNEAWTNRVNSYQTVGRSGPQSCSPVGPGGWTGCSQKLIEAAYSERQGRDSVHAAALIAEARAKRMATVDQDAAETQARVEQAEKDYEVRQRAAVQATEKSQAAGTTSDLPSKN